MATRNIKTKLVLCNLMAVVAKCDNRVPMDNVVCCKFVAPEGTNIVCPYQIPFDLNLTLTIPEGPTTENGNGNSEARFQA